MRLIKNFIDSLYKVIYKENSRIFVNFLIMYSVIVFVVSLFFYPIYNATLKTVKENAVKESYNALAERFRVFDNEIIKLQDMGTVFRNDRNFADLVKLSDSDIRPEHYYNMSAAQKFMRSVMLPTDTILKLFYIFNNNSVLISRDIITTDRQQLYGQYFDFKDVPYDQWTQSVFDFEPNVKRIFKPSSQIGFSYGTSRATAQTQAVTYILPLTNELLIYPDSVLVYLLDSESVLNRLCPDDLYIDGFLCLFDQNGHVILNHNGKGDIPAPSRSGVVYGKSDGVDTAVMEISQSESGLRIAAGIPLASFTRRIEHVMRMLRFFFFLSILVGLITSFLFSYRSSKPVRRLLSTASAAISASGQKKNAYESIHNALLALIADKEGYRVEINNLGNTIKASLFEKLLTAGVHSRQETARYIQYLRFLDQTYIVAVLKYPDMDPAGKENQYTQHEEMLKVISAEILGKLLPQNGYIHNTIPGKIVVIFPVNPESNPHPEYFKTIFTLIAYEIVKSTSIQVKIGISSIGKGFGDVRICYVQAAEVLRLVDEKAAEAVFVYSGESAGIPWVYFGLKDIRKLYELLLSGDALQINGVIDGIYRDILVRKSVPDPIMRCIYYNIQNVILCAARDIYKDTGRQPDFGEYSEEKSVKQLFEQLKKNALGLCEGVEQKKKSRNAKLKEDILQYLRENLADPNLSAPTVAARFEISEKYVYGFVKEQTGLTFGSHLEGMRLAKAKSLLLETDESIGKIAGASGFNSLNTFFKVFKREYGVSPGTWRDSKR